MNKEDIKSYGVIYPEIKVLRKHGNIYSHTTVRRKHLGKWYLQDFLQIQYMTSSSEEVLMMVAIAIDRLHKAVYESLQLSSFNEDYAHLKDMDGKPINIPDTNQEEETVRLKRIVELSQWREPKDYIDLSDD